MANNQQLKSDLDLEQCLRPENITPAWKTLITDDQGLHNDLKETLDSLRKRKDYTTIVPTEKRYLKAFSYAEPGDIKVVIIGTSPALSAGNYLAFSGDPEISPAIKKFNDAAKKAGIKNYEDHEVWASNGVLLVNAALSMSCREDMDVMEIHNNLWLSFMKGFLSNWLAKYGHNYTANDPLFVITLGYAYEHVTTKHQYRNYADGLWFDVKSGIKDEAFKKFGCDHPTCPNISTKPNNFATQMPIYFREILHKHKNIFELKQNLKQTRGENIDEDKLTSEFKNKAKINK